MPDKNFEFTLKVSRSSVDSKKRVNIWSMDEDTTYYGGDLSIYFPIELKKSLVSHYGDEGALKMISALEIYIEGLCQSTLPIYHSPLRSVTERGWEITFEVKVVKLIITDCWQTYINPLWTEELKKLSGEYLEYLYQELETHIPLPLDSRSLRKRISRTLFF